MAARRRVNRAVEGLFDVGGGLKEGGYNGQENEAGMTVEMIIAV